MKRTLLLLVAAIGVLVFLWIWASRALPPMHMMGADPEDQPPIIVTNGGSILFEGQDNSGRPKWVRDSEEISYEHGKRMPLKLHVSVENPNNPAVCQSGVWDATKIDFTFTNRTTDGAEVVLHLAGNKIKVHPHGEPNDIPAPFYVIKFRTSQNDADAKWWLKKADLKVKSNWGYNATVTCTFDYKMDGPTVTVFPIGK